MSALRQFGTDPKDATVRLDVIGKTAQRTPTGDPFLTPFHLAKVIYRDDTMQAIVDPVAEYWARTDAGLIVSSLTTIGWRLHASVPVPNHFHLVLEAPQPN